jgi:UDP-glucuronate decarboxylase
MLQLAREIIDLTGSASKIAYRPLPQDDPKQRQPDIALARSELGWEPVIRLRDGLARTIAYFDAQLKSRRIQDVIIQPAWSQQA